MREALIKFDAASQDLSTMHALILARNSFLEIMVYESAASICMRCSLWKGPVDWLLFGCLHDDHLDKALESCVNQRSGTLTVNLHKIRLWRPSCGHTLLFIK